MLNTLVYTSTVRDTLSGVAYLYVTCYACTAEADTEGSIQSWTLTALSCMVST